MNNFFPKPMECVYLSPFLGYASVIHQWCGSKNSGMRTILQRTVHQRTVHQSRFLLISSSFYLRMIYFIQLLLKNDSFNQIQLLPKNNSFHQSSFHLSIILFIKFIFRLCIILIVSSGFYFNMILLVI